MLTVTIYENSISMKYVSILGVSNHNLYTCINSTVEKSSEYLKTFEAIKALKDDGIDDYHPEVFEEIMTSFTKTNNIKNFWRINPLYQSRTRHTYFMPEQCWGSKMGYVWHISFMASKIFMFLD